ncbi:hypothetical protein Golax_003345, partial [Gossypium laxum]|nr:hypothetical protein [Gossypium laxum]
MKINCLHCMGNIDIQQSGEDTKHFIENYLLELEGIKKKLPVQRIEFEWRRPPETTHGIQFGYESSFLRVEIEGDALSAIRKLQNLKTDWKL